MIASYSTSRRTAVLDPGHGGTASAGGSGSVGAVGPNGLREKDLNLEVAQQVFRLLNPDIHVVMTRTADTNLSLGNRAKVARDNNADYFVSIHFNACSTPSVDGTVVFVAPGANAVSRSLAQALADGVSAVTGVGNRGVREHNYGVIQTNRHLQGTAACLLEVAFLSNPVQARRLEAQAYRRQLAEAIANVLRRQAGLPVAASQAMAATRELVGCGVRGGTAARRGLSASQMAAGIGGMGAEAFLLTHPSSRGRTLSTEIPLDPGTGGQCILPDALEIGDIIVSTTDSIISNAIRRITDAPVSHAMLYVGDGQIVEAVSEGVVLRPLSSALDDATVAVAFRHPTLTIDQALLVRDYAGQQVGKSYDYWGIVRQAGFQLDRAVWCRGKTGEEYQRCVDWRGRINLGKGDDDSFFCSELVLAAYAHAGLPLTDRPPHWATPGDIADLRLSNRLGYVGHLKVELPASQSLSGLSRAYEGGSGPGVSVLQPSQVVYQIQAGQEYGPRWRSQRPPGLPANARRTSRYREARPYIEQLAGQENLGQVFVDTVAHLAETESGAMFARPANAFDVRPPGQRPAGTSYVSAWGAFQFNRDAWRGQRGIPNTAYPWDASAYEELGVPIRRYAGIFREVRAAGGSPTDAARGIRLWHRTPAHYRRYVEAGGRSGFSAAWANVPREHASVVDQHLRNARVLTEAGSQSLAAHGSWGAAARQARSATNFTPLHGPGTGDVFHPTNASGIVILDVVRREVANEARGELGRWRTSGGAIIREGDSAGRAILASDYWPAVGVANPLAALGANWWSSTPWSAAFVSYTVNAAAERLGLADLLANSAAHMRYTWQAYRDRDARRMERYWPYPPDRVLVDVGDIIVKARGTGASATWNDVVAPGYQHRSTHGDIVVALSDTAATVIGGNVGNSVGERSYPLSNGFIDRSSTVNAADRVFAILKLVGSAA